MKKLFPIVVFAAILCSCGTASQVTRESQYAAMYNDMPVTILVMPPINNTSHVEAKDLLYTSISRPLAEAIRRRVVNDLQPDNRRQSKQADGSIRLLDSAASTAVLVECGFLSNVAECEKISSLSYQRELSFSIFCGIMETINRNDGAGS